MISVESSVVIHRPVEDVFAVVSDQTNEPKWHTDVIEIRHSSGPRSGLGSAWLVTVKFMGRAEYEVEVTGFEPDRRVEITTTSGPMKPTATYPWNPQMVARASFATWRSRSREPTVSCSL